MFHIGQLIVCIDDNWDITRADHNKVKHPTKGMIYTIRGIQEFETGVGIVLEEIVNKPLQYHQGFEEAHWLTHRFRPIKETSIDCFTTILNKVPEDA